MKNEKITIFNENLLKSLDIQRQCAMEEFVRKMREERMCQIYNNDKRTVGKKDNKMEELKKRPFCGGNASKVFDQDGTEQPDGKKWAYTVVCGSCCASTGLCWSEEQSIRAWNDRVM